MTALLLLLLAAPAQELSQHPCDVIERRLSNIVDGKPKPLIWNPLVGAPVNLFFCGPPAGESVPYKAEIDGVAVPSPGLLSLDHLEANASPFWQTAGVNGLVPYVSPGPIITLTTPGLHTIRVTYGAQNTVVSFQWLAAIGVCVRDENGFPRPSNWIGTDATGDPVGELGDRKIQALAACAK